MRGMEGAIPTHSTMTPCAARFVRLYSSLLQMVIFEKGSKILVHLAQYFWCILRKGTKGHSNKWRRSSPQPEQLLRAILFSSSHEGQVFVGMVPTFLNGFQKGPTWLPCRLFRRLGEARACALG